MEIVKQAEGKNYTDLIVNIVKSSLEEYNYALSILLCNELIMLTNELLDAESYKAYYDNIFESIPVLREVYIKNYGKIPDETSDVKEVFATFAIYIFLENKIYKIFAQRFLENKEEAFKIINDIFPKSMELKYTIIPEVDNKDNTYFFYETFKMTSMNDFLKFDTLKMIERGVKVNICANCGKYFIPQSKSNEKYCNNTFSDGKTCKALSYKIRLNGDEVEQLYRKAYKTQNAKKQRYAHIPNIEERFKNWSIAAKNKKELCNSGKIKIEEFKKWLEDNKDWNKKS